jgi:hypothetical protein
LHLDLFGLAAADEEFRIRFLDARRQRADDRRARRTCQFAEFAQRVAAVFTNPLRLDQQRALAFA